MLRHFRLLVNSILLLTVPAMALSPQGNQIEVPAKIQKVNQENQQVESSHMPSYDEIMEMLDILSAVQQL